MGLKRKPSAAWNPQSNAILERVHQVLGDCLRRIVIPAELQPRVLDWYHEILVHPGENRMEKSLTSLYYWKNLKKDVHHHCKHCKICQLFKTTRKTKYGLLPAKTAEIIKWSRVNVDLWGPKTVHNKNGKDYKIYVLTMIAPVTG